jgi:IS5 family transposase
VTHHQALFEHPPNLVAGDRGVHSAETESRLSAARVKRVSIPAAGPVSAERQSLEHMRSFKRGYRWRAGIEGRIASLRRDYGWRQSTYHGQDGMERWLGLGVIARNVRIRTNLSKDEAKSSSICDDIRKIVQISLLEGARPWQVYHKWSVP